MHLLGVHVEVPSNQPIVLLREATGERRVLPIFIGTPEATAIAMGLEQAERPGGRPQTHDPVGDLLAEVGAWVESIVITELRERIFSADIHFALRGEHHPLSARPSDAIAIAVRLGVPISAEEEVLESQARPDFGE